MQALMAEPTSDAEVPDPSALLELIDELDSEHERLRRRLLETMEWLEQSVSSEVRTERELEAWRRHAQNVGAELDALHSSASWRLTAPLRVLNGRLRRSEAGAAPVPAVEGGADRVATVVTPVFIPVRDRLTPLLALLDWLERRGRVEVWLIDNASTYPPLLEFLDATEHRVVRLERNLGHRSPFLSGTVQREAHGRHFVISDPDVVPDDDCPPDAIEHFLDLLDRYPEIDKVGFGLRIDDLPDGYPLAGDVRAWESRFWTDEIEPGVYRADIDTTFALYRPLERRHREDRSLRTGSPYLARHTPWYVAPGDMTDEDRWYRAHVEPSTANWDRERLPRWKQRWLDAAADDPSRSGHRS
jgi:hypothetical protein